MATIGPMASCGIPATGAPSNQPLAHAEPAPVAAEKVAPLVTNYTQLNSGMALLSAAVALQHWDRMDSNDLDWLIAA